MLVWGVQSIWIVRTWSTTVEVAASLTAFVFVHLRKVSAVVCGEELLLRVKANECAPFFCTKFSGVLSLSLSFSLSEHKKAQAVTGRQVGRNCLHPTEVVDRGAPAPHLNLSSYFFPTAFGQDEAFKPP